MSRSASPTSTNDAKPGELRASFRASRASSDSLIMSMSLPAMSPVGANLTGKFIERTVRFITACWATIFRRVGKKCGGSGVRGKGRPEVVGAVAIGGFAHGRCDVGFGFGKGGRSAVAPGGMRSLGVVFMVPVAQPSGPGRIAPRVQPDRRRRG